MAGSGGRELLVISFFKNIDATLNKLDSGDLDCMTGFYFDIDIIARNMSVRMPLIRSTDAKDLPLTISTSLGLILLFDSTRTERTSIKRFSLIRNNSCDRSFI